MGSIRKLLDKMDEEKDERRGIHNVKTRPSTQAGLGLLWDGVQQEHVFELVQQMRCGGDPWYAGVLDECRDGCLSCDNHAFLHYEDTSVPGSWNFTNCATECKSCDHLAGQDPMHIRSEECTSCQMERMRRARVQGCIPNDTRLHNEFSDAISIVANNDLKYDICKRKAAEYARNTGQRLLWCPALDIAASHAVQKKPNLPAEKKTWLTYHDKKCGGLYGMLPLVKGMRVSLTTHIDRSEKALLRGKYGTLVGWKLDARDESRLQKLPAANDVHLKYRPTAIFVKFEDADWKLCCMQNCTGQCHCTGAMLEICSWTLCNCNHCNINIAKI